MADDVRGGVLAAAVKLIEKDGLAALSMREVARAAGVSHQAPYHYFEDRESILAAIAEEGFTVLAQRMENAVDSEAAPAERLATLGRVYVEFACDHPALFRVMFRPDFVDAGRFPRVRTCGERAFATLPAAVQACIDDGLPVEPSVQALMVLAWSMAHGFACLLLDGPLALKLPDAVEHRDALIRDVATAMQAMFESKSRRGRMKTRASRPAAKRQGEARSARALPKKRA
ncbi:MAG: TetR/AcrR family transcriptional regulator [Labilithrix sp.]|nr:TetR/AcrR family transcriptional regulator [Labilithrix sp.]